MRAVPGVFLDPQQAKLVALAADGGSFFFTGSAGALDSPQARLDRSQ
jgi:hypothetical protein